jgi:hypothetical protein
MSDVTAIVRPYANASFHTLIFDEAAQDIVSSAQRYSEQRAKDEGFIVRRMQH